MSTWFILFRSVYIQTGVAGLAATAKFSAVRFCSGTATVSPYLRAMVAFLVAELNFEAAALTCFFLDALWIGLLLLS